MIPSARASHLSLCHPCRHTAVAALNTMTPVIMRLRVGHICLPYSSHSGSICLKYAIVIRFLPESNSWTVLPAACALRVTQLATRIGSQHRGFHISPGFQWRPSSCQKNKPHHAQNGFSTHHYSCIVQLGIVATGGGARGIAWAGSQKVTVHLI